MAARCKARNVFASWNIGILVLDHTRGMGVSAFFVFLLPCVRSGLAMG
jgi:hypothetical protein